MATKASPQPTPDRHPAPHRVQARTGPALGAGQPIDPAVRAPMERRLGHSFAHVRLHAGAGAAASARALDAAAYTFGTAVVLDGARYRPGTALGQAILRHELAHVAQQSPGGTAPPGDAQEREAHAAARPGAEPFRIRQHSAPGIARLSIGDVERGLWARVPDTVKPYVRPLAREAKAELDKIVPPTTEVPAAAAEAVAHPVAAAEAAAQAARTSVKAAVPSVSAAVAAAKQHARASIRDTAMHAAGQAKGVLLEAGNIVDTLAWLPYAAHGAAERAVANSKLGREGLAAYDQISGYAAQRAFAERHGLIDPDTGAPAVSGRLSAGIDSLVDKGEHAAFGDLPPEQAEFLTSYEQGELEGAIGTQVGLAFVGVEEVQLALKIVGAVGGAKGIYDAVKRNPGGWWKTPDFWAGVIGLAMGVLGLRASKASGRITTMLLRSGALLNAVPAVWKLVHDYDDPALAADPGRRQKALKADIVAIVKIAANAIADIARGPGAHGKAPPEAETTPAAKTAAAKTAAAAPMPDEAPLARLGAPTGIDPTGAPPPAPPAPPSAVSTPSAVATPAALPPNSLRPLTPPLRLPAIESATPVPQGLQPGAIGTYGRAVPAPHPFALQSQPPGAPGATRGGGRMPQTGRTAAGVYAEHQTPAAVAHEVLANHELHGPAGQRRGGRDTQEALTASFPEAAKAAKDRADAALLRDVQTRQAAGETVAPIEVMARGAQHSLDATAPPGAHVPPEQITKLFFAEQDQFFSERHGYTALPPGAAPPPGTPPLPSAAEWNAHLDQAFAPFAEPAAPAHGAGPGSEGGEQRMIGGSAGGGSAGGDPPGPVPGGFAPSAVHDAWTDSTRGGGLGKRPPPLPRPGAPAPAVGETSYGHATMAEAMRAYDDFRARAPGREIGVYRNRTTGEYAVVAGRETSVGAPRQGEGAAWTNVLHNHPNPDNVLTYRNPSPADMGNLARAAAIEKRPMTSLIEHDLPGGGRRMTAMTVSHNPFRITIDYVDASGAPKTRTYDSAPAFENDHGARTVYAEPGSKGYADYWNDIAEHDRKRND